jgi:hypothetical protein
MFIRKTTAALLVLSLVSQLGACGTLLYPERKGQVSGRLDIAVIALDAIGLLFYFVPGVVAFAVDFVTGAIYLPGGRTVQLSDDEVARLKNNGKVDEEQLKILLDQKTGTHLQGLPLQFQVSHPQSYLAMQQQLQQAQYQLSQLAPAAARQG